MACPKCRAAFLGKRGVGTVSLAEVLSHFQAGRLPDAERLCADLRGAEPANAEAWHLGGVIAERLGNLNLGVALVQKAVALRPGGAEARRNLGSLLARQGRITEALPHFEAASRLLPKDPGVLNDLARARNDLGDTSGAIEAWRGSLERSPKQPAIEFSLAVACQNLGRIKDAAAAYRACVELDPARGEAWLRLGHALSILCRPDDALACYREAEARGLRTRAAVMAVATLAPMEASTEALERRRTELGAGFTVLSRAPMALRDPYSEIGLTNFYLAYHGRDNRALNEAAARFYLAASPGLAWTAQHLASEGQSRPARPRVGFLSPFFYSHSTGKMLRGLIERRDRASYEAILLRAGGQDDGIWRAMAGAADKTYDLPRNLAAARVTIAAQKLDLLLYTDIAADPFTYFLAFSRLARVQATTWGHADTSGIPAIDHYISWRDWEPPGAAAQYSERLVLMTNPPTCFARPATVPMPIGRAALGIADAAPFYFCPHNLVKFHPDFDRVLADLLARDTRAVIAIPQGHVDAWTDLLKRRLRDACGSDFDRLRFLPRMPHGDFLGALKLADALLDPMHFCGGITSLEAFAIGCPIVTWPGAFMRGRMTYGFYRRMRHLDLIAAGPTDYVEIAFRLANDPAWREQQRAAIAEKAAVLFDDIAAVREFEAVLAGLAAGRYPAASTP